MSDLKAIARETADALMVALKVNCECQSDVLNSYTCHWCSEAKRIVQAAMREVQQQTYQRAIDTVKRECCDGQCGADLALLSLAKEDK